MEDEVPNFSTTAASSDSTTPPRTTIKPSTFSLYTNNNTFKRRHCTTASPLPPPPIIVSYSPYRECMCNHAARIGGHALDGCCEFMPSSEPLNCAACGCHLNFHRRDPDDPSPLQLHSPAIRSNYSHASLKKGVSGSDAVKRKRFRTRFSSEQKEKMHEFAEKFGWKLQRIDKKLIEEFCGQIGVGKEVLRVWMHNNKNTLGRREVGGSVNGGMIDAAGERLAGEGDGDGYSSSG